MGRVEDSWVFSGCTGGKVESDIEGGGGRVSHVDGPSTEVTNFPSYKLLASLCIMPCRFCG